MDKIHDTCESIKTGDIELLIKLLNENPSLADEKTEQGISLIQFAAYCRNKPALDVLRKYRSNFDIFEAASIGVIETIKNQIENKPTLISSYSPDGFTVLGLASFFGHYDIVKFLLEKGANPNLASTNQFKVAPIHSACAISNYEIAEILIKHGADVNAKQMQSVTPLHSAAHNGSTKLVKLLIFHGADVNSRMENGQTPLFMALEKGFQEAADLLKSYGGQ